MIEDKRIDGERIGRHQGPEQCFHGGSLARKKVCSCAFG